MKDYLKRMLVSKVDDLNKLHSENLAYLEFNNFLGQNEEIKNQFSDSELKAIFPKPVSYDQDNEIERNDEGDVLTSSEFTEHNYKSIHTFSNIGWLTDKALRDKIYSNKFYQEKIRPAIGEMPEDVKKDIELHATHILGRCNDPRHWGTNKQGLVYGMVQSGKTASMITLIGQARTIGYRIFIVLAGDKASLRDQTQKRINDAFDLTPLGHSKNSSNKIRSLTQQGSDYLDAAKNLNALDIWDIKDQQETIIICIKKQTDNLNKLLTHLKEIEESCKTRMPLSNIVNYSEDFKTMIIDDEADYASQDTKPTKGGAQIHNDIVELRKQIKQNCYIAYTATPQACIGANPVKLVGYPTDFIWLLEPYRDLAGETTSYLGAEEFYEKFSNQIVGRIPRESWPHYDKIISSNNTIKSNGVYDKDGHVIDAKLTEEELKFLNEIIDSKKTRDDKCVIFRYAIIDYLLGCSIRWYRHMLKCQKENHFINAKPTLKEIEAIEKLGQKKTEDGYSPFPYHALMFNLSYMTGTQSKIVQLIEILWKEIKIEWSETKHDQWKNKTLFVQAYEKQIEKSSRFEKTIPDEQTIEYFLDIAISITAKQIIDSDKYVYLLNSRDEGSTLQYENRKAESRPKKASIIVGGNILSRGLTIENLSVTVFARSQVMSLGDTNLQMCRWFGHKKKDIDIQTVYMQPHSQELFQDITSADKELRDQFRRHIFNSTENRFILLSLFNSPLFRSTSPSKSKFFMNSEASYSGLTVDLLEHTKHPDFKENNQLLNNYLHSIENTCPGTYEHKRATVYRNVPQDSFLTFFESLNFMGDSNNISPTRFKEYLEKWRGDGKLPDFNIAVFGFKNKQDDPKNRRRKTIGSGFKTREELIYNALNSLAPFRGGKSDPSSRKTNIDNSYCGDAFIDQPLDYHINNYEIKNLRRDKNMPILFLFYKIKANYVGRFPPKGKPDSAEVYFSSKDQQFIDMTPEETPLITLSIATPKGGPIFKTQVNKEVLEVIKLNENECEEYFEKSNISDEK